MNEIKVRQTQMVEVKKLKLNPKNPRINDAAVDTLAKSIEKFGFNQPLFCDSSYVVYCGNTRLKALRKLKVKEVPCIVADDLTPEEIREYALVDNKSAEIAEWNRELLNQELAELDMSSWDFADWSNGGGGEHLLFGKYIERRACRQELRTYTV
ncbi:MAG: ParB N-terminal domain-containing protein [Candidatus Coproplasma sp.]